MSLTLELPPWLDAINGQARRFADEAAAMAFVIDAARRNIVDGGGPFGAAVLTGDLELVALGVNRVLPAGAFALHAEILALLLAQQKLAVRHLSERGHFTLVTSCAPCAMCFGALHFSGIRRLVCGARSEDAEAAGFDEGDKPVDWPASLARRGITLAEDVCREAAAALLRDYAERGGPVY